MIIPILNGLLRFSQAPVTWTLFLINALVFFAGMGPSITTQNAMDRFLDDDKFLRTQGRLFSQYITEHPSSYTVMMHQLAEKALAGDPEKTKILGSLAVRNSQFLNDAPHAEFRGDQVEIARWKEQVAAVRSHQARHPSYIMGLTADQASWPSWLSYIFVHSGPYHFLGNMYFLLIFGSMLEPLIGGLGLLITFLASGTFGAGAYILLSGPTAAPLIGASGAVSGLMVLFTLFFWRQPVRYMYVILPSIRYVGFVFLPAWLVALMFVLSDVTGHLGTIQDFGGVAYSAHIGGELTALLIGLIIYLLRYGKPGRMTVNGHAPPLGKPISIHELTRSPHAF